MKDFVPRNPRELRTLLEDIFRPAKWTVEAHENMRKCLKTVPRENLAQIDFPTQCLNSAVKIRVAREAGIYSKNCAVWNPLSKQHQFMELRKVALIRNAKKEVHDELDIMGVTKPDIQQIDDWMREIIKNNKEESLAYFFRAYPDILKKNMVGCRFSGQSWPRLIGLSWQSQHKKNPIRAEKLLRVIVDYMGDTPIDWEGYLIASNPSVKKTFFLTIEKLMAQKLAMEIDNQLEKTSSKEQIRARL